MSGQIIILHGPSSSGKSTTAKALQDLIERPFWHISIDHLRDSGVLPDQRIKQGDFDWSGMRAAFFDGFHRSLAAYASAGNNLIVEHILDDPAWVGDLKTLLKPFDVLFVGLHCDLDELRRRESRRGNRPIGSAEQDFHAVHVGRIYDLEIDSGTGDACDNAHLILTAWRSKTRTSEFAQ